MLYQKLDVSQINRRSAYQVSRSADLVCRFETSFGLIYEVGFTEDFNIRDEGVFQFFITEVRHNHYSKDDNVRQTIWCIIEEFFRQNQAVMVYICDTSDGRQGMRNRLFSYWFNEYEDKRNYVFIPESITVDGISYYASILVRKDHPQITDIVSEYKHFVEELRDKWE